MPDNFIFSPTDHTYHLNGKKIPGVTEILKACGVIDEQYYTPESRDRGTFVHLACKFLAEGDLEWATVPPQYEGFVRAYEKFLQEFPFAPSICEEPIYHPSLLYGTIPDQIGTWIGADRYGILELKTGHMAKWTALQTAFQAMAKWPNDYMTKYRLGLELHADGSYKPPVHFDDPNDFGVAQAMLTTAGWKRNNL